MKKSISTLLCLFMASGIFAQYKIGGKLIDGEGKPVEFADIMLCKAVDSSLVKHAVTDENGEYEFENVNAGDYVVTAYLTGYRKTSSEAFTAKRDTIIGTIGLEEETNMLNTVTVTGRKRFVEQHADKLVINPDANISTASDNILDVLAKSPGVTVDKDGNIAIKGKSGVSVMIDNKPARLSGEQLAAMLKNMQSTAVDKIEIIENPPARYDAEGASGIINIKTKQGMMRGWNGSFTAGTQIGKNHSENSGLDLNYRNEKWDFFTNTYIGRGGNYNTADIVRIFKESDGSVFNENAVMSGRSFYGGIKIGADCKIGKNHTVGAMARYGGWNFKGSGDTKTSIADAQGNVYQREHSVNTMPESGADYTAGINYRWDVDSTSNITVDLDYARYRYSSSSDMDTRYTPERNPLLLMNGQRSETDIYSFKADYENSLSEKTKLEAGVKFSRVNIDSDMDFKEFVHETGVWGDPNRMSNRYLYSENINAAYLSLRRKFTPKFEVQAGLRGEQTVMSGNNVTSNQTHDRNYFNLFPTLFLNKTFSDNHQINASYSYRIGRPNYRLLNPFVFMVNPYTYNQGNPDLQPQFTHSLKLSYILKQKYILSAGYSKTNEQYTQIIVPDNETKVTIVAWENLSGTETADVTLVIPVQPARRWTMNTNLTGLYSHYKSPLGNGILDRGQISFFGNIMNTINLTDDWSLELSGRYRSTTIYGMIQTVAGGAVDAGIQRQLFDKKLTLKAGISDAFKTDKNDFDIIYGDLGGGAKQRYDSRRFRFNLTWRFGNDNLKPVRQRSSGLDEEAGRTGK